MKCPNCESSFMSGSCVCGYKPPTAGGGDVYAVGHCCNPGCTSAIRYAVSHGLPANAECKWCESGVSEYKKQLKKGAA